MRAGERAKYDKRAQKAKRNKEVQRPVSQLQWACYQDILLVGHKSKKSILPLP